MLTMFNKDHPEQGVLYILIANLISAVVKPALLYKYFLQLRFKFDIALGKEMLVYALPLVVAGFAGIVNETLETEGRSYKNIIRYMVEDGLFKYLPKGDDSWTYFLKPFMKLTRKEKNKK